MAGEDKLREYLKRATVDLTDARRRLAEADAQNHEPIAVVGMACRFPGAADPTAYWDLLASGRSAVRQDVPNDRYDLRPQVENQGVYTTKGAFLEDVAGWDAEFFGSSPQEALRMDPQQRLLMELTWEALEDAGTPPPSLAGSRTAVMVGYSDILQYARLQQDVEGQALLRDPYAGQGSVASVVAGRLAYHFDLRGPTLTLDTACSSSLVAVHLAGTALRRGECDLAVAAGGFLMLHTDMYVNACATNMLSRDGLCRTFDKDADGYVLGEGAGVVVLQRLSDALRSGRPIHAVVRGSAVNQDGRSNGLTAPNRGAQVDVIRRALSAAGATPGEVAYVEAHGSGTQLGDAIEIGALGDVFAGRPAEHPLHVGAVKTNIGHTQAAAGMAGLIKAVLVLGHGTVPPNLNLTEPNETVLAADGIHPVTAPQPLAPADDTTAPHLAGVSSFGWCGTNAHLVLEAAPDPVRDAPPTGTGPAVELLPVSAASEDALREQLDRMAGAVGGAALADVARTLQSGRAALEFRRAVVAGTPAEAQTLLADAATAPGVRAVRGRPRLAYLLPGVGDQYRGLGQELYRSEPAYAAAVDRCVEIARDRCAVDLTPVLFGTPGDPAPAPGALFGATAPGSADDPAADLAADPDNRARTAHLFLFTVQYALAQLLDHRGVRPDLLIGYSLGEYVAACLGGVFTLDDALWVVSRRARLIEAAPPGRMFAAAAGPEQIAAVLAHCGGTVDIAALNGPMMTVLSGTPDAIDTAAAALREAGIAGRQLRSGYAFHSTLLEPARAELAQVIASVPRRSPTTAIISNVTGEPLTDERAVDPEYWADHLTRPVRFADGLRAAAEQGVDGYVELGAGQTLGGLLRQNTDPGAAATTVLGTLPGQWTASGATDEPTALLETCGRLWELGATLDWPAVRRDRGRHTDLPSYPFQRSRYYPRTAQSPATPAPVPALPAADLCYAPTWQQDVTVPEPGLPAGPLVVFTDAGGVGSGLADLAEAAGCPVLEVVAGTGAGVRREGRRIVIDPSTPAHYREVFAALAPHTAPLRVVHLWSLLDPAAGPLPADAELRTALTHGYDSLLLTLQALDGTASATGVRLLTGTAGAAEVLGGDCTAPQQALAHGLGRVGAAEYPALTWRGVDLDPQAAPAESAARLAEELTRTTDHENQPSLVAWRRGRRLLKNWGPVPLPPAAPQDVFPLRPHGTALITGGTRGLGLALARHLVGSGARRLALVGRTDLRLAAATDPGGTAAQSLLAVAELEAAGAEVLLLTADVGVPDQLRAALTACREHFGSLDAVLHVAGVPASGMAFRQTLTGARKVLAPKVLAMGPLAELVGPDTPPEHRPGLLVLYSSAVSVFGGLGEGDYCAANSVLDAYGAALAASAPSTKVLTVAWGPWQHDDWQAKGLGGALADRVRAHRAVYGFSDEGGSALLGRLVANARGAVVAVRQSLVEGLREWAKITDLDTLVDATATASDAGHTRFPRPRLRIEYAAPRTDLETSIADCWGRHLGIETVGIHDPFFDLGGNSLVGMAMVAAIEKQLDRRIAPAVLFEYPTVAAFAAALDGATADRTAAGPGHESGSARGARRRARGAQTAPNRK